MVDATKNQEQNDNRRQEKTLENQTIDHNIQQEEINNLLNANFPVNPAINDYSDPHDNELNAHLQMKFDDRNQEESETENFTNNHGSLEKVVMMNPNHINNPDAGDLDYDDF